MWLARGPGRSPTLHRAPITIRASSPKTLWLLFFCILQQTSDHIISHHHIALPVVFRVAFCWEAQPPPFPPFLPTQWLQGPHL